MSPPFTGDDLKKLRSQLHLNRRVFADRTGLDRSQLSRDEKQNRVLSIYKLQAIARGLDCELMVALMPRNLDPEK